MSVDHPLRHELNDVVHARPYELLTAPLRLVHLAVLSDDLDGERALLAEVCRGHGVDAPHEAASFCSVALGGYHLRWEQHTEFTTWTLIVPGPFGEPFSAPPEQAVCADWLTRIPGQRLVATRLEMETRDTPARDLAQLGALFATNTVAGSRVADGCAEASTDYQIHADGYSRVLIHDLDLRQRQAGRLVQRLLEIGTYRMMALLALPLARDYSRELASLDGELAAITERITRSDAEHGQRRLLDELSTLAARVENGVAQTNYRFSATRAYYRLIRRRIEELREVRQPGMQTFAEFLERRLSPAVDTCESVAGRLDSLSTRVARASDMLRTRVDMGIAEQNHALLASMDRRARLQLRLQQTVEGLSVVVLSYYGVGLVSYLAKGLKRVGVPLDSDLVAGIAVPVIIGLVFYGVYGMRRRLDN